MHQDRGVPWGGDQPAEADNSPVELASALSHGVGAGRRARRRQEQRALVMGFMCLPRFRKALARAAREPRANRRRKTETRPHTEPAQEDRNSSPPWALVMGQMG